MHFIHPATESYICVPGYVFGWAILILALSTFAYIIYKRYLLIRSGQLDPRLSNIGKRIFDLFI